jgi:hypothetical protein
MHFAQVIEKSERAGLGIHFALILGILMAAFVLLCGKSQAPFDVNELYGILD